MLNISGSKNNQTIKLGQLIEYNKLNIFPEKLYRKWGLELSVTKNCLRLERASLATLIVRIDLPWGTNIKQTKWWTISEASKRECGNYNDCAIKIWF